MIQIFKEIKMEKILITFAFVLITCMAFSQEHTKIEKKRTIMPGVSGKIENIQDNKIGIIFNEMSRSRVTYIVEGDDSELRKNAGKYATITGQITNTESPWTKIIKLEKIIKISSTPVKEPAKIKK